MLWAAESTVTEEIPALQPPREEIPPTFWEQHGMWVVLLAVGGLALAAVAIWWFSRSRPSVPLPPAEQARQALEPLRRQPEDGLVLSRVSQVLRRYVIAAFGMPPGEVTTSEFCRALEENLRVGPELTAQLGEFLRVCDQRKFAPSVPQQTTGAVDRALELIAGAEARLAELRQVAEPATMPSKVEGAGP
jgi:hypothetical protein